MKEEYQKPEVYTEKLAIDSLRAVCCSEITQGQATPNPIIGGICHDACECQEITGPS